MARTPLLLIHGFAQTAKSWQTVIETLSDDRPVHAIELPGHGGTALTREEPTVESARRFVAQQMDRAGIEDAAIWGYSQGARVALDFALNESSRTSALILESGTAGIADPLARADRRSRDFALSKRIENSTIEQFVDLWESVPALTDQSRELIAAQRDDRLAHDPIALAAALRGIGQSAYEPMWDRLAEITVPTLVISGARDSLYTTHADRIAASVPGASHAIIEGAGHSVHLEKPVPTVKEVEAFLALLRD